MTGYTVHTGASEDFINNWDNIFGEDKGEKKKKQPAKAKSQKKAGKKKPAKKKK